MFDEVQCEEYYDDLEEWEIDNNAETDFEAEYCYECQGYGDDYYVDEDGELVCACFDCPFSPFKEEE